MVQCIVGIYLRYRLQLVGQEDVERILIYMIFVTQLRYPQADWLLDERAHIVLVCRICLVHVVH